MKLLSHLSPADGELPAPADPHLLTLGRAAWAEAVARADGPSRLAVQAWSASPQGQRFLAAIFGNSPFLSGIAVREPAFLGRIVMDGADTPFAEIAAEIEMTDDLGEDAASLMRRLRLAKRRVALLAAAAELARYWSLEQQMAALSRFAEAALGAAIRHLLRAQARAGALALADPADPETASGFILLRPAGA
jgi:glutamate-ammonia-ligase adenylyltransferase